MDADDENLGPMIDDEIYANGGEDERRSRPIISGEPLDVEAYASLYSGRTKISRLLFIAEQSRKESGGEAVELEALRMAYDEIKKGENTQWFRDVAQKIGGRLGPEYQMDLAWCESVDRRAEQNQISDM